MGMFFPCVIAAILNGCALQIFREPMKVGNGPLMALYIFIFTTFILLWSVRLYPRNLRKIGKLQFVVEFLIAEFLMEDLIIDFWFPLEKTVLDGLPTLAQQIEDWLSTGDWTADKLVEFLKAETTGFYVSYAMAVFFLIATLHASRVIDLRTLTQEGPVCFVKEIGRKIKLGFRRLLRLKLGVGKRKVKINEKKNTQQEIDPCRVALQPSKPKPKNGGKSSNCGPNRKKGINRNIRFCPIHNPMPGGDSSSSCGDFEDLGLISDSDLNCL